MIFLTLGTQKFQFNRLLKEVDRLIIEGKINEEVFAQIGYSDYMPQNFKYKRFLNREEFIENMNKCNIVITHGGTGAIINAVKNRKKVVAIPRLKEFEEHIDDHQLQIVSQFDEMGLILKCNDLTSLSECLDKLVEIDFIEYISNTDNIINSINAFLKEINK